jgi:hypothetical protein
VPQVLELQHYCQELVTLDTNFHPFRRPVMVIFVPQTYFINNIENKKGDDDNVYIIYYFELCNNHTEDYQTFLVEHNPITTMVKTLL